MQRSILSFPLPKKPRIKSRVVYTQSFGGADAAGGKMESVALWLATDKPTLDKIESYCQQNNLKLEVYTTESMRNQAHITAETPNQAFKPTLEGSTAQFNR
jgi:hypothetical protein